MEVELCNIHQLELDFYCANNECKKKFCRFCVNSHIQHIIFNFKYFFSSSNQILNEEIIKLENIISEKENQNKELKKQITEYDEKNCVWNSKVKDLITHLNLFIEERLKVKNNDNVKLLENKKFLDKTLENEISKIMNEIKIRQENIHELDILNKENKYDIIYEKYKNSRNFNYGNAEEINLDNIFFLDSEKFFIRDSLIDFFSQIKLDFPDHLKEKYNKEKKKLEELEELPLK